MDSETGLYYFGARYYDPRTSIWASPDPILAEYMGGGHSPSQLNLYGYVSQHPLNMVDPDGRREYQCSDDSACIAGLGAGDWTTADRNQNTERWKNANAYNLQQVSGYNEYDTIEQRADFYRWYQGTENARGGETRWAGAAAEVADDVNMGVPSLNSDVSNFLQEGNRVIFNDVFSKLRGARNGSPLKGEQAQKWDMSTLSDEQHLTQPLYDEAAANGSLGGFSHGIEGRARQTGIFGIGALLIRGEGPPFKGANLSAPIDRWTYGMQQMGYDPSVLIMPQPSTDYINGSALSRVR